MTLPGYLQWGRPYWGRGPCTLESLYLGKGTKEGGPVHWCLSMWGREPCTVWSVFLGKGPCTVCCV